jgi:hypothetical protein
LALSVAQETTPVAGPDREVSAIGPHQAAVDDLTRAYNDIADGYGRIHDAASIAHGQELISRGIEQLKSSAQRGRSLAPLSAADRSILTTSKGPELLRAVDRVIRELQRLKAMQGLKSDFDRLIAAYIQVRQEIDREIQGSGAPPSSVGGPPGLSPPPAPRLPIGPRSPRRSLRNRR